MAFYIPWTPHAKQRPRVTKTGHAYTPAATRKAEAAIITAYQDSAAPKGLEGPLSVAIQFENEGFHISFEQIDPHVNRKLRGDIDNYAKTVLDSLNGIAYSDDSQIGKLHLVKL
jgi:Holliday junction resolvase RusA-like endonuclease